MPRRSAVSLTDVADSHALTAAFLRAARGHRASAEVQHFAANLHGEIATLRASILDGTAPVGHWTAFEIRDPKPRRILAPCFHDRVLHHALMARMGPVLERSLVDDTYACRVGRGTLAAVRRAQVHARRFPWFVKADMRAYFASIDHDVLRTILGRRFKNRGLLDLCDRILARTPGHAARGLPIGALTSQYFANVYLDALDRHLLETLRVRGMVRYMDDVLWWCDARADAVATLASARDFVSRGRALNMKEDAQVGRSAAGVTFLGFRVLPGTLGLSLRRRRRYIAARRRWEAAYVRGEVDALGLQRGYDAALAVTAHADVARWRAAEMVRRPPVDA